ncbi:MarR family winged helix-turn-helix transcriptional regulator [Nocardioides sp.]|uniref:MarR family winged helix-turn-helix transcriptional regulator n=1 Tax=Nocardioides sp. TaxID=35761 RepID=UPI0035175D96
MTDGPPDVHVDELGWGIREIKRAATELDRVFAARLGLHALDYQAMDRIMDAHETPLGTVELSTMLGISPGSATELVDRLERAGYVVRGRDTADRRRVRLEAPAERMAHILEGLQPMFEGLNDLAAGFTPTERDTIAAFLRGAVEVLQQHTARLADDDA